MQRFGLFSRVSGKSLAKNVLSFAPRVTCRCGKVGRLRPGMKPGHFFAPMGWWAYWTVEDPPVRVLACSGRCVLTGEAPGKEDA